MSNRVASGSSKRAAADVEEGPSSSTSRPKKGDEQDNLARAAQADDEGMGEFEDQYEDELESESGEEDAADAEPGMEIDGVPVDDEIQRVDDDDEEGQEPEAQVYLPGDKLEEGQTLEPDQSAYEMLHRLNVTWPCLSFDHLRDHLGSNRQKFPHTAYLVAGTQADVAKNNELMVMKASGMHKTNKDGGECPRAQDCIPQSLVAVMLEAFGCMRRRWPPCHHLLAMPKISRYLFYFV